MNLYSYQCSFIPFALTTQPAGLFSMSSSQLISQSACAHKLRILADSTRLAVLQMLMERPLHVQDMNAVLGLEQSLLSHHLKVLRQEGFVTAIRDGKAVLYHLAAPVQPAQADRSINLGCCLLTFE